MDDSDRTESQGSLVAIPEHLIFAIEEWLEERIRQGCDGYDGEASRRTVVESVHLYDAFASKSLTALQVAELADGAADWLGPRWPTNQQEAEEVTRLLTATRGLLALRDHALAAAQLSERMAREDRGGVRRVGASVIAVDPELVEVLRLQSLLVLEVNHEPFEEVRDLGPSELLEVAAIFRDAMAVLDTIGWLPSEQTKAMDLEITLGHFAQLRQRRAAVAMTILDRLDGRDGLTEPEEIAEADEAIGSDRRAADGLLRLLRACGRSS